MGQVNSVVLDRYVWNNQLYIFDPVQQKFIVYSLDNYELIHEAFISREFTGNSDPAVNMLRGANLIVVNNENLILKLSRWSFKSENDISKILYHRVAEDGALLPGSIIEVKRFPFFFRKQMMIWIYHLQCLLREIRWFL